MPKTALIVVDVQNDFLPGGSLAVAGGFEIVPKIAALLHNAPWDAVVVTQDWHPPHHSSFASQHNAAPYTQKKFTRPLGNTSTNASVPELTQTLWPDHCVQNTPGAELHPEISAAYRAAAVPKTSVQKGQLPDREFYSCFQDCWGLHKTDMGGFLRRHQIEQAVFVGLAYDYCVLNSARDCAAAGCTTFVLKDCTRSVYAEKDAETDTLYAGAGVRVICSDQLPLVMTSE